MCISFQIMNTFLTYSFWVAWFPLCGVYLTLPVCRSVDEAVQWTVFVYRTWWHWDGDSTQESVLRPPVLCSGSPLYHKNMSYCNADVWGEKDFSLQYYSLDWSCAMLAKLNYSDKTQCNWNKLLADYENKSKFIARSLQLVFTVQLGQQCNAVSLLVSANPNNKPMQSFNTGQYYKEFCSELG